MMRNKWIAVVTIAAAGWLTACGGDAGDTDDTTTGDTAATTPAPTPAPAPTGQGGTPPEGATADMVAMGQQIFTGKGNCFTCHRQDATGNPGIAPNLTDAEWINISAGTWDEIQTVVRNGVPNPQQHPSPMPPMGGATLTDQEIQAVAAYVYSVSHQGS